MPTAEDKSTLKEEAQPVVIRREAEKDLISWTAPARPFKRRDREYYVTIIAIAAVVGLILFMVEGWMPVVLLISLIFLFYVMSTVEPEGVEYKITSRGIKVAGKRTDWQALVRYWFSRRFDNELLVVESTNLPGRIEYVLAPESKEEVKKALSQFLPEEEAPPSYLDKAANWFAAKLPGNK